MIRLLLRVLHHLTGTPTNLAPHLHAATIRDSVAEDHWAIRGGEDGLRDCDG